MEAAALLGPTTRLTQRLRARLRCRSDKVRGILDRAGFTGVSLEPFDAEIGGGDIEETVPSPSASAPRPRPGEQRDKVLAVADAVRKVVTPYATPKGVFMPAAVWIVRAGWGEGPFLRVAPGYAQAI